MGYWTKDRLKILEEAAYFKAIAPVCLAVQKDMGANLVQVCGPISTGGMGDRVKNIKLFKETISKLKKQGLNVYDQTAFEKTTIRLRKKGVYSMSLLEDVYRPLFESGRLTECFFIYGWESSFGSCWEHDLIKKEGIKITYLPKDFIEL